MNDMKKLSAIERERTYHYADGTTLPFTNIIEVGVTKSGFHKLTTDDGIRLIVAPGWRFILLRTDEWSF